VDKVIRILILEDRTSDADLMEFALMEAGFTFTSRRATDEKTFIRRLEEFSPDLILSDYDLPQYSGALALAEAKARFPNVPFILVTGALDKSMEKVGEILAGGASDYVLKNRLDLLAPAVHLALGFGAGRLIPAGSGA
jgi:CheY-like chemotaxis protein